MTRKMTWAQEPHAGLVNANSSLSGEISHRGRMYSRLLYNPPYFDSDNNALTGCGSAGMFFCHRSQIKKDTNLSWKVSEKTWPIYQAAAHPFRGVQVQVKSFSPLSVSDSETIFFPAIYSRILIKNTSAERKELSLGWQWNCTPEVTEKMLPRLLSETDTNSAICGSAVIGASGADSGALGYANKKEGIFSLAASLCLQPDESRSLTFWLGVFDKRGWFGTKCGNADGFTIYAGKNAARFEALTDEFTAAMPSVGDSTLDRYLRWYTSAAVVLTKGNAAGQVIQMGYQELNQRDAFWTSMLHLAFWPDHEQTVLRESAHWMQPNGKIPTTILPLIDRRCDLDINCYFCLRIARYYQMYQNVDFLAEMFPYYKRSVEFLLSQDRDGDRIPEQYYGTDMQGFWGDWKDVPGVEGRMLSPHTSLLWLAVLQEGAAIADLLQDKIASTYHEMFHTASEKINRDVEKGGMWQKDHYAERWYDGSVSTEVLIDQFVGLYFNVIPEEREGAVIGAILRGENDFGIPETWPYRTRPNFDPGGIYHNGGIWPYLLFGFCTCLYRRGRSMDAERLIKKLGYYDLEKESDYSPNEYISGTEGRNCGKEIQGWSADLFGAVYYGAFTVDYPDERTARIQINLPKNRDFTTRYVLPKRFGTVTISRKKGKLKASRPQNPHYRVKLLDNPGES